MAIETSIIAGHEVKAIVDFATKGGFDLLIGYHGHSRIYDHLWDVRHRTLRAWLIAAF